MRRIFLSLATTLFAFQAFAQEKTTEQPKVIIPMVFHIVHGGGIENITDDQVLGCIDQLNEDYNALNKGYQDVIPAFSDKKANIGFSFALAKKDPEGNSTSGITRHFDPDGTVQLNGSEWPIKKKYAWPNDMYLNVYVIRSAGGEAGSAWAYYPGGDDIKDGVMSSFWAVGQSRMARPTHYKIMTHEVGHWADLAHTFAGGCEKVANDSIDDTPPTTVANGCDYSSSPCGVLANTQNFMDYGSCTVMFTKGQKSRMWAALTSDRSGRKNLWSEENLLATGVTGETISARFYAHQVMTYPGNEITFHDFSEAEDKLEKWEWEFIGGSPAKFVGKTPPAIHYEKEGKYDIRLKVTSVNGTVDEEFKKDYILVQKEIYMQEASFKVSDAMFYDHGYKGRYGNRTDAILSLTPSISETVLEVDFISFRMEDGCDSTDYLDIYDGPDTNSRLIGKFCGQNSPGLLRSTHSSGALTFVVHSNVEFRFDGWEAKVKSVSLNQSKPQAKFRLSETSICRGESVRITNLSEGNPTQFKWKIEGGKPSKSTRKDPVVTFDTPGIYSIELRVKNKKGKSKIVESEIIAVGKGQQLPVNESFESSFPPMGWEIVNPDGILRWEKNGQTGANSSSAMIMNNADNKEIGEVDEIITAAYDLSEISSAKLEFDLGYTKFDSSSKDMLTVFVSSDCGSTWKQVFQKNHIEMETAQEVQKDPNAWMPSNKDDWRKESIDLTSFLGSSYVKIKFHNTSGFGTRVWIDNVEVK